MINVLIAIVILLAVPFSGMAATIIDYNFNDSSWGVLTHGSDWSMQSSGGKDNTPAPRVTYYKAGTAGYWMPLNVTSYKSNQFWIEMDVKMEGTVSGGCKFIKLFGSTTTHSQNNMTIGIDNWQNVQREVAYYMDTLCTARHDGSDAGSCTPTHVTKSSAIDMRGGGWGHFKVWVKRADPGVANGEFKVWWNGVLRSHVTNMDSNPSGSSTPYFERIEFGGYTHSTFSGSPWSLWIDNLYVGTTDKGSTSTTPPPTTTASTIEGSSPSYSVNERDGTASVTISRTGDTSGTASVQWGTFQNTATTNTDYTGVPWTTVNFAAGESSKVVSVKIIDDTEIEGNEDFSVALTNPVNANLGTQTSSTVIIMDNDSIVAAPPTIEWGSPSYSVNEGEGTVSVTILRTGDTSGTASSGQWGTFQNTATLNTDYTGVSWTTVNFAAGESSKVVSVKIIDDTEIEGNEDFSVALTNPVNANLGTQTSSTVIIMDNDSIVAAPPTIEWSSPSYSVNEGEGTVSVTILRTGDTSGTASVKWGTYQNTATTNTDYTGVSWTTVNFAAGESSKVVSVQIIDDTDIEGNEDFSVALSDPVNAALGTQTSSVVKIVDNDSGTPTILNIIVK